MPVSLPHLLLFPTPPRLLLMNANTSSRDCIKKLQSDNSDDELAPKSKQRTISVRLDAAAAING